MQAATQLQAAGDLYPIHYASTLPLPPKISALGPGRTGDMSVSWAESKESVRDAAISAVDRHSAPEFRQPFSFHAGLPVCLAGTANAASMTLWRSRPALRPPSKGAFRFRPRDGSQPIFTSTNAITTNAARSRVGMDRANGKRSCGLVQLGCHRQRWHAEFEEHRACAADRCSGRHHAAVQSANGAFVVAAVEPFRDLMLTVPDGHGGQLRRPALPAAFVVTTPRSVARAKSQCGRFQRDVQFRICSASARRATTVGHSPWPISFLGHVKRERPSGRARAGS